MALRFMGQHYLILVLHKLLGHRMQVVYHLLVIKVNRGDNRGCYCCELECTEHLQQQDEPDQLWWQLQLGTGVRITTALWMECSLIDLHLTVLVPTWQLLATET